MADSDANVGPELEGDFSSTRGRECTSCLKRDREVDGSKEIEQGTLHSLLPQLAHSHECSLNHPTAFGRRVQNLITDRLCSLGSCLFQSFLSTNLLSQNLLEGRLSG